jgi:U4/U6 small nuclear ribonucleoprotein PRP31
MKVITESFIKDINELSEASITESHKFKYFNLHKKVKDCSEISNIRESTNICKLITTTRYKCVIDRVDRILHSLTNNSSFENFITDPIKNVSNFSLLADCNQLIVDIDDEIALIHNFNKDLYRPRFPELEFLVHHPIDYARVVKAIGKEENISQVNLNNILPSSNIMVITVTASTTTGKPLAEDQLEKAISVSGMVIQLDTDKEMILIFVQIKMKMIAPNLSILLGPVITSKLMGLTGGLVELSKIPACNIKVLGARRKNLADLNPKTSQQHQGLIYSSQIIQQTPIAWRYKALKLVSTKCGLLSRVDAYCKDLSGEIEKWQEPPSPKIIKPLAVPDGAKKKRRGGRRLRKYKEKYGMTESSKAKNRVGFNQQQDEIIDGEESIGLRMFDRIGEEHYQKKIKKIKIKYNETTKKKVLQSSCSRVTSGLSSSLVMSPLQGIELNNSLFSKPKDTTDGTQSYFSNLSGFKSVRENNQ